MQSILTSFVDSSVPAARRNGWLAFLIVTTLALSYAFSCAVPLAALAAVAALTLSRRQAIAFAMAAWFANQLMGFFVLGYPRDANTLAWGIALGLCTLAAVYVAHVFVQRYGHRFSALMLPVAVLAVSFVAFQGVLLVVNLIVYGHLDAFTLAVKSKMLLINAATIAGIAAANMAATRLGVFTDMPVKPYSAA